MPVTDISLTEWNFAYCRSPATVLYLLQPAPQLAQRFGRGRIVGVSGAEAATGMKFSPPGIVESPQVNAGIFDRELDCGIGLVPAPHG
jgi:hypothetical protein